MSCSQGKTIRPRSPLFFSLLAVNYSLTPPTPLPPKFGAGSGELETGNERQPVSPPRNEL